MVSPASGRLVVAFRLIDVSGRRARRNDLVEATSTCLLLLSLPLSLDNVDLYVGPRFRCQRLE